MEKVLPALALMRPGQSIRLLLHREPFPLYSLLAERGYRHTTQMEADDSDASPLLLGVLFIGGFAVSVMNGMLYKIVPFLTWFHLQAQLQAKAGSIPTMKEMIAERRMRGQFRLHLAACVLLVAVPFWPQLAIVAGSVLALSALLLWVNLLSAVRRFSRHGGRFS